MKTAVTINTSNNHKAIYSVTRMFSMKLIRRLSNTAFSPDEYDSLTQEQIKQHIEHAALLVAEEMADLYRIRARDRERRRVAATGKYVGLNVAEDVPAQTLRATAPRTQKPSRPR